MDKKLSEFIDNTISWFYAGFINTLVILRPFFDAVKKGK